MLSIVTGLAFQLMVARATTWYQLEEQYDLWFNMSDILAYFTLLAAALPFWTRRFVARGFIRAVEKGEKWYVTVKDRETRIDHAIYHPAYEDFQDSNSTSRKTFASSPGLGSIRSGTFLILFK